jgi:hypothetical protein
MAHFAKLDSSNYVIDILSVDNSLLLDDDGVEQESKGVDFLTAITGHSSWKQTSYNTHNGEHTGGGTPFRKNYAGINYIYDATRDAFIEPKPWASWTLNESTCRYDPPIPEPVDELHHWNEDAYQADNTKGWELAEI